MYLLVAEIDDSRSWNEIFCFFVDSARQNLNNDDLDHEDYLHYTQWTQLVLVQINAFCSNCPVL